MMWAVSTTNPQLPPNLDNAFRASSIFRKVGPDDRQRLSTVARVAVYARGDAIFSEGDPSDAFYTITGGRVKVFKMLPSGKEVILEIFGAGDPLGAIAAYEGRPFPATAMAMEDTTCLILPRGAFFALLEQHPSLVRGLLYGMTQRLIELTNRLAELSTGRVEARLARLFLKLAENSGRGNAKTVSPEPVVVVNTAPLPVTVTNASADQGTLGPTKPSDLVTIRSTGAPCGASPWRLLDLQVLGDGTGVPFTIPVGKVLIVTSVDFRQGSTGSPGMQEEFVIFPSAANISVSYPVVDLMAAPGSSDGRAGVSAVITGVVIKAGNPCWGVNNIGRIGSADVIVRGYLTADR